VIVDSHTHVVCPDGDRYPLAHRLDVGRSWWTDSDDSPRALVAAMDTAGVDRAVVVQAVGPYGYDCRCAVDAVEAFPERLALVGAVDMAGVDPAAALGELAGVAPLRGVRVFGVDGAPPTWLTDGRAAALWAVATELNCTIVATLFMADVPSLRPLVEAEPSVPVAVDHAGFPPLATSPPEVALTPLLELADLEAIVVKVSSHVLLEAGGDGDPADLVGRLAEAFGSARLVWGSDHPQTAGLAYPEMVDLARHALRLLPVPDQRAVLGENAVRLWWAPVLGADPHRAGPRGDESAPPASSDPR
jgi:L-fuconolactonase